MNTTSSDQTHGQLCPGWCINEHGHYTGEDDYLHAGAQVVLTGDVTARLCASVDPDSGETDGPYVLIDGYDYELTLDVTRTIGLAFLSLVADGADSHPR
jgi:hypothetical protein